MHFFYTFIVFSTLLASVKLDDIDPTPPPVKAKATVSFGEPRLFSGENVEMTCSVPDDPLSDWTYEWFHNDLKLFSSSGVYNLEKAQIRQSGNYTCRAEKAIEAWPYSVTSTPSDPLEIDVDGGWVLLRTPFEPLIVEETMTLTCRVRDNPRLLDVIFYKNGVEVFQGPDKHLLYPNLTLKDNDVYSCRATWFKNQEYQSGQSVPSSVIVLDKLETPRIEFSTGRGLARSGDSVELRCITKLNTREQDVSLEYYFFKDGSRMAPATATNTHTILGVSQEDAGFYSCKVRVRALNVERWSNQKVQLRVLRPVQL